MIMTELEKILGEKLPEIWVRLPPRLHPTWWKDKLKDPVVNVRCNLYGHPMAGLHWEIWSSHIFKQCGFQPVPGWECLWFHPDKKLLLSSYVDDVKMAGVGKKEIGRTNPKQNQGLRPRRTDRFFKHESL